MTAASETAEQIENDGQPMMKITFEKLMLRIDPDRREGAGLIAKVREECRRPAVEPVSTTTLIACDALPLTAAR